MEESNEVISNSAKKLSGIDESWVTTFLQTQDLQIPLSVFFVGLFVLGLIILMSYSQSVRRSIKSFTLPGGAGVTTNLPEEAGETNVETTEKEASPAVAPLDQTKMEEDSSSLSDQNDEQPPTKRVWWVQMLFAAQNGRRDELKTLYENALVRGEEFADQEFIKSNYCQLRLREMGEQSALIELKELEQKNLTWTLPSSWLANYYSSLEAFKQARSHISVGMARAESDMGKLGFYKELMSVDKKAGVPRDTLVHLYKFIDQTKDRDVRARAYVMVSEIYDGLDDIVRSTRALEQSLSEQPQDSETRFSLAYKYSESSLPQSLSLYHYQILEAQSDSFGATHNNIGAHYSRHGLKGISLKNWEKSGSEGNDRAIGNIALRLIKAGFFELAKEKLNSVSKSGTPDQMIVSAWSELQSRQDKEEEEKTKLTNQAADVHNFVTKYLSSLSDNATRKTRAAQLRGEWVDTNGSTYTISGKNQSVSGTAEINDSRYSIKGQMIDGCLYLTFNEAERRKSALSGLILGSPSAGASQEEWERVPFLGSKSFRMLLRLEGEAKRLSGVKIEDEMTHDSIALTRA